MTLLIIKCQICDESIASAESSGLSVPLNGTMFGPPFPERMKHSLLTEAPFEYLRCPTCTHNPFLRDDEVLTPDGIYRIPIQEHPLGTTIINSNGSKSIYVKAKTDIKVGFVSLDDIKPIDTFTTKFLCECCDPPREFKTKSGLSSHIRAKEREANKNDR